MAHITPIEGLAYLVAGLTVVAIGGFVLLALTALLDYLGIIDLYGPRGGKT